MRVRVSTTEGPVAGRAGVGVGWGLEVGAGVLKRDLTLGFGEGEAVGLGVEVGDGMSCPAW